MAGAAITLVFVLAVVSDRIDDVRMAVPDAHRHDSRECVEIIHFWHTARSRPTIWR